MTTVTTFPLTRWQDYVLKREIHPNATERFLGHLTLSVTLHVRPGLGDRRLNRAFKTLCKRHDVTRLRFHFHGTAPSCAVADDHPTGVTYHDYSGATEDQIETIALQHTLTRISMKDDALICLDVLKFGPLGDVMVFRAHHAIVDGYGFMLLFEDLIKLMLGMPLLSGAGRYADYYAKYGRDIPADQKAHDTYWRGVLFPPAEPINIGRVKAGLPFMQDGVTWLSGKNRVAHLTKAHTDVIHDTAKSVGVTPFILVNTAFLEALSEIGASNDFYYTMTVGRFDSSLSKFAGHHTLHPLMRHRRDPAWSLADASRHAAGQLVDVMRHVSSPCSRRDGEWDRELHALGAYPRQVATGMDAPTGMIQRSPFAKAFTAGAGTSHRVGMFEVRRIKPPTAPGDIDEIGFRPTLGSDGGELSFNFDAAAYSDTEILDIAGSTMARLGLKSVKAHWIT